MNILILGDGPEERAWARAVVEDPEQRLVGACPAQAGLPEVPGVEDLDAALVLPGVEAVVVGGDPEFRAEALRRVASMGLPAIVLHPPGEDADAYYQVALSRQETGAVVVPDLPGRLHPGVVAMAETLGRGELGAFRELRYEVPVENGAADLVGAVVPKVIDVVCTLLGEIEAVTAIGDPPGERPTDGLIVQVRGPEQRRAELRLTVGAAGEPARLSLIGGAGALVLEHDPTFRDPAWQIRRTDGGSGAVIGSGRWDRHAAILGALGGALAGGGPVRPDLRDGTRAMELAGAVRQSLRRGRTVDLVYEEVSEAGTFKSVMTGLGCGLLTGSLALLAVALAGPALGIPGTIFLAYAIPPALVVFLLLQGLRVAVREKR